VGYNTSMKPNRDALLEKRQAVLQQMQSIDRLRRGSLSKQFFKSDSPGPAPKGPYYVLQCFFHGKKCSQRIPQDQAAQVQQDVENYRHFQTMAEEFVTLSDQITRLGDVPVAKKNSSRRRSPTNSFGKPRPS
jgi:hypothetical protein